MAHDNNEAETWPRVCETLPAGRHVPVLGGALMSVILDSSEEPGAALPAGLYWFDPVEKVYRLMGR